MSSRPAFCRYRRPGFLRAGRVVPLAMSQMWLRAALQQRRVEEIALGDKGKTRTGFGNSRAVATACMNPSGRNKRTVWTVATKPFAEAHFATFPPALIEPCILAGCPEGGICLDPFFGAGTTGLVAKKLGRHFIGIELNEAYIGMAQKRIAATPVRLDNWM